MEIDIILKYSPFKTKKDLFDQFKKIDNQLLGVIQIIRDTFSANFSKNSFLSHSLL